MCAGNARLAGPSNGCIEKLSAKRLHTEIEVFAKVIHKMDVMTAADPKESLANALKQSKGKDAR
jgi:hypothetical protein